LNASLYIGVLEGNPNEAHLYDISVILLKLS